MFTKQELEFLLDTMEVLHLSGTVDEVRGKVERIIGIREKLELLMADHPEDEAVNVKAGNPPNKKPAAKKKSAAKKK